MERGVGARRKEYVRWEYEKRRNGYEGWRDGTQFPPIKVGSQ